jgi:uncharacterized protein YdhG (YjbR/CyaY superfamily)
MSASSVEPESVEAYIQSAPAAVRPLLRKVRAVVRKNAPHAREIISYRIPALKHNGILMYYAAFKDHIGVFPPIRADARLERALAKFRGPKGNLRFPLDGAIPYALLGRAVRLRVKQDAAKVKRRPRRNRG